MQVISESANPYFNINYGFAVTMIRIFFVGIVSAPSPKEIYNFPATPFYGKAAYFVNFSAAVSPEEM